MPLLTNSRLAVWRRCKREHYYRYVLRLSGSTTSALRFGDWTHRGLEAWYLGKDPRAAIDAAAEGADPFDLARCKVLLAGYFAYYTGQPYRTVAVEQEFRAPLPWPRGWSLAGKLDLVVTDEHGRMLAAEHKTSSDDLSSGAPYWARLRLDSQCSLYLQGAKAAGYPVEGVVYDVLAKPGHKPLKATETMKLRKDGQPRKGQRLQDETPEEYAQRIAEAISAQPDAYYARSSVVRLEHEQREFADELVQWATEIDAQGDRLPVRNPDACVRFGTMCAFYSICVGERSSESFVKLEWAHPELERQGGE